MPDMPDMPDVSDKSPRHQCRVLLFGEHSGREAESIRRLYRLSKDCEHLAQFLRHGSASCKMVFDCLPRELLKLLPAFNSLLELAEHYTREPASPVYVSCVLLYFAELGELVFRAARDASILTDARVLIGLSISLFPAAVAASAKSVTELASVSLEAFASYFNCIFSGYLRTCRIENQQGSWSCMVSTQNDDLQSVLGMLDELHQKRAIPPHERAWVNLVDNDWITVNGPPPTLDMFVELYDESGGHTIKFPSPPAGSVVYSPHIPVINFETIRMASHIWDLPLNTGARIMSTQDFAQKTLGEVIQQIMYALRIPVMFNTIFAAVAEDLRGLHATAVIVVLGYSARVDSLECAFRQAGVPTELGREVADKQDLSGKANPEAIAILGMSATFPHAVCPEVFWQHLMKGGKTHKMISKSSETHQEASSSSRIQPLLSGHGVFDDRSFNVSPTEALQVESDDRLLLMMSFIALEQAGYSYGNSTAERRAVYIGEDVDVSCDISSDEPAAPETIISDSTYSISRYFGFEGGSYSVNTGSTSSLMAIHLACYDLINQEFDMALAGGIHVESGPSEGAVLEEPDFLVSADETDSSQSGSDKGPRERTVGMLVLKRLEDAIEANDNIQAVITGWGNKPSEMDTRVDSQEQLIQQVLRSAGADKIPGHIDYIELHSPSTALGDPAETRLFEAHIRPDRFLHIGHSDSVEGISPLFKTLCMLKKRLIPPQSMVTLKPQSTPGLTELDASPIHYKWPILLNPTASNKILLLSSNAAGLNICLLIEGNPRPTLDVHSWHLVTVSSRTDQSAQRYKMLLLQHLLKYPGTRLSDISFTTATRQRNYAQRSHYAAQSTRDLIEQLQRDIWQPCQSVMLDGCPTTVFVFGDQRCSYSSVAKELFEKNLVFRYNLLVLEGICRGFYPDLACDIIETFARKPPGRKRLTMIDEHLAVVSFQLALAQSWRSWGVEPEVVLGHGIGEYAALCVAGVLSVTDTLWLVWQRADLFETAFKDGLIRFLKLSAPVAKIECLLNECNTAGSVLVPRPLKGYHISSIVGGPATEMDKLEAAANGRLIPVTRPGPDYAIHSQFASQFKDRLEEIASSVKFLLPSMAVLSTAMGEMAMDRTIDASYIANHTCKPLYLWEFIEDADVLGGFPLFVEIGANSTCMGLIGKRLRIPECQLLPFDRDSDDLKVLTESLGKAYTAGLPVDLVKFNKPVNAKTKLIHLPTYTFDVQEFWEQCKTAPETTSTSELAGETDTAEETHDWPGFVPTATIQKVVCQNVDPRKFEVTFASSTSNSILYEAINNHSIEGLMVCPVSVFVDMALTAAAYLRQMIEPDKEKSPVSLAGLRIDRQLIFPEDHKNVTIQIRATAEESNESEINISFDSHHLGTGMSHHGSCQVVNTEQTSLSLCNEYFTMETARAQCAEIIERRGNLDDEKYSELDDSAFYKLCDKIEMYRGRYQGVKVAFIPDIPDINSDAELGRCVAEVRLTPTPWEEKGAFMLNPYHFESFIQLAVFALNFRNSRSNEGGDVLHLLRGIGHVRLFEELDEAQTYVSSYHPTSHPKDMVMTADIGIHCDNRTVGVVTGLEMDEVGKNEIKFMRRAGSIAKSTTSATVTRVGSVSDQPTVSQENTVADAFLGALAAEIGLSIIYLDANTKLADLGVDSLMEVAILKKVKHDTGRELPRSIFSDIPTIRAAREVLMVYDHQEYEDTHVDILRSMRHDLSMVLERARRAWAVFQGVPNTNSTRCPLLFMPGSNLEATDCCDKLILKKPVWFLKFPLITGDPDYYSPRSAAGRYMAHLKIIQPSGPYILGGIGLGAVDAYETACLLMANGDQVKKLILVNMNAGNGKQHLMYHLDELYQKALRQTSTVGSLLHGRDLDQERTSLLYLYHWKPARVKLYHRPVHGTLVIRAWDSVSGEEDTYDENSWKSLVGEGVEIRVVNCDQSAILEFPHVLEVTKYIDDAVEECGE
ncbi:hypothetical protein GGR50DRAFT_693748 [Xylaria sp. CBS 124048]|nr:hypothetical protein GGR50DRAFT_693748 [Xylaria sp. CBS 124048]